MPVSQEFLGLLETIRRKRNFENYELDHLLSEFHFDWINLQGAYKNSCPNAVYSMLVELSELAYEMLYHLQQYEVSFDNIILAAETLHTTKNAGYAGESNDCWHNFRECEGFGISALDGCITRLSDKYRRFVNVYEKAELNQVNESAVDTLRDFGAYCLIAACLLQERN